ncbi:DUF2079 domain-containing protein [Hymenobacter sp. HMF4947]|uniref:DUF2079 domain-containing protein n=1 Tax=Hymenobacter ginkgonis TaxID=2682976 RepID=A0A7K1TDC0_9BACT|nr:DUF2079 domain-containing protein [Hymenobacter ginkgonis]MVN76390.1 DUF2079 domain-containing protein [Hymenobacter ginkgonis]
MPAGVFSAVPARRWRTALLLFFGLLYALVSLVNQLNFRTAAFDLGIAAQAVGEFAHLRAPRETLLLDAPPTNFLAIHFSLTPVLGVPLSYLLGGAWALLLVQIGALLLGALGVWRYAQAQGASPREANWALAFFAGQWGIFSALSFDYHDNVVGAMALPWLALWVHQRRGGRALTAAIFLLVSKENMALWLAFVLLGLAWQQWPRRAVASWLVLGAVAAVGYFLVITHYVMPALDTTHRPFTQIVRYAHLGASLPAAVANVLSHPALLWATLFQNTLPDANFDYIKLELWGALLVSGGWALLRRPWYAWMLLPILGQKLLANDYALWGINGQYSIEFAPVLALAVADALRATRPVGEAFRRRAWAGALAGVAVFTIVTLYTRRSEWYNKASANFLTGRHYRSPYPSRAGLYAALARVPAGVPLSTTSSLVPHLLDRRDLFLFPVLRTARLVALLREPDDQSAWPLSPAQARQAVAQLRATPGYRVLYEDAQLLLLSRSLPPAADTTATWQPQP